jgi:flagellar hook-basal body complex protein FliE
VIYKVGMLKPPVPLTPDKVVPRPAAVEQAAAGFGAMLDGALSRIQQTEAAAADASRKLATGEIQDLSQVVIAAEKAALTLQYTLAIRNKVLEAYQEIMRMPV